MKTLAQLALAVCIAAAPTASLSWTLEPDTSTVAFGSIKNDYTGESHKFSGLSGGVDDAGQVSIEIDLASVNTNIEIRDERMLQYIFKAAGAATVTAQMDLASFEDLEPGASRVMEVDATLDLLGRQTDFYLDMFVLRLDENRVLASSNAPAYIATEDLGIDAGIDALQEIASLDSITRVTPLTARLIFTK